MADPTGDLTQHGPGTRLRGVRAHANDRRHWLQRYPVCAALAQHDIEHAGIVRAGPGYRIVRTRQLTAYFMACVNGEGRVRVDGRWRRFTPGMGCLLPSHTRNEFHAVGTRPWEFCYVCYLHPPGHPEILTAEAPVMARFDADPLRWAIEGLRAEQLGAASPALAHYWVELIHGYVLRFAHPFRGQDRLQRLWQSVAAQPAEEWSLDRLARQAHCSREHLRRLCLRELGRSPIQQVTYLRLQRAAELLASTSMKVEEVGQTVGYENAFAFSTAFKKGVGWPPSDYRIRGLARSPR